MSKESKPADRWSQVFTAACDRPESWCKSCGYYRVVHGEHRGDCAAQRLKAKPDEHIRAVEVALAVLGGHIIATESPSKRTNQ